jgi:hypothetical protein
VNSVADVSCDVNLALANEVRSGATAEQ